jgi:2-polyprenyl-6-hydroxyphenyl methylase/3-demethylubiquinone-9 3-methyltransferase
LKGFFFIFYLFFVTYLFCPFITYVFSVSAMKLWQFFVVALVALVAYMFTPPMSFPDRLVAIPENATTIDNAFYNLPEFASSWWGSSRRGLGGLHLLNPGRTSFFQKTWLRELGDDITKHGKFLDVGCGGGIATEQLARFGFDMTGIDISPASLEAGRQHANAENVKNVRYVEGSAYDIPFPDATFDGVIVSDVLEHIHDIPTALSEMARVLKPGGVLVYDTITRTFVSHLLHTLLQDVFGAIPGHTHDWRMFVTPEEMSRAFENAGLVVCCCRTWMQCSCSHWAQASVDETRSLSPVINVSVDALRSVRSDGLFAFVKSFEERPRSEIALSYMGWARKPSA